MIDFALGKLHRAFTPGESGWVLSTLSISKGAGMEVKRATPISLCPPYVFHDLRAQGLRVRELPLRTEEAPETDRDVLGRLPIKRAQQESFDRDLIAAEGRANSRISDGIPASASIKIPSFRHIDT